MGLERVFAWPAAWQWSGLRAAELCGLQVGDVELPTCAINPNARPKPGLLRVERTVMVQDGELVYDTPKTKGSRRRVPLPPATVDLMRDYLAMHPRADEATAPLFPSMRLIAQKPTGLRATGKDGKRIVPTADEALAALTVDEAEARLELDWSAMLRHNSFYKAVYRPAVMRANRLGRVGWLRRQAAARAQVPRAASHLRQSVRRGGHSAVGDRPVHGARQGDDHALGLRPSIRRRPHRRYGRAGGDGDNSERRERGPVEGLIRSRASMSCAQRLRLSEKQSDPSVQRSRA